MRHTPALPRLRPEPATWPLLQLLLLLQLQLQLQLLLQLKLQLL